MNKLGKREKLVLWLGIVFVSVYVVYAFPVSWATRHKRSLEQKIQVQKDTLIKIRELGAEHARLSRQRDAALARFAFRPPGFRLFSFLDEQAGEAKVKQYIKNMKPSSSPIPDSDFKKSSVEMKLVGLTTAELADYLARIEGSRNSVSIRRISITQAGEDKQTVDVVMQVATLEK